MSNLINKKINKMKKQLEPMGRVNLKNGAISGMPSETEDSLMDARNMKGTYTSQSMTKI